MPYNLQLDKTKGYLNGGSFFIHKNKICSYAINSRPEADVNRVKKRGWEGQYYDQRTGKGFISNPWD